jgi:serine protease Do
MSTLATGSAAIPHIIEDRAAAPRRRTGATRLVAAVMRGIIGTVALALTMLGFGLGTPSAHATDQTAIDAKIGPSLMYIYTSYSANLLVPGDFFNDGQARWEGAVTLAYTCSGVVVDPAGFIATDGHCVDYNQLEVRQAIVRAIAIGDHHRYRGIFVDSNGTVHLTQQQLDNFINRAMQEEWLIEGKDPKSPPARTVQVIQPMQPNRVISEWTTAQVVDFQQVDNEDNALLKVSNVPPLPALPVANSAPPPGTSVTSSGFPGDVGEQMDTSRSQPPSFKEGSVSSHQVQQNGAARTEISAAMSPGMSGGPVLDNTTGEVIGLVDYSSYNPAWEQVEAAFNFATDAAALHAFLLKNGVHLVAPTAPAQPSFPWVWIAVGGAAVVVLLALPGVLVVRRRAKRRSVPPIDGSQLLQQAPLGQPAPQPLGTSQQSPTGAPQPPRDLQSDLATARPDHLASIAPEVMTPTPNGTAEIK